MRCPDGGASLRARHEGSAQLQRSGTCIAARAKGLLHHMNGPVY